MDAYTKLFLEHTSFSRSEFWQNPPKKAPQENNSKPNVNQQLYLPKYKTL